MLVLCTLLGGGCSSLEPVPETQATETLAVTEEKRTEEDFVYPKVLSPLTWERIRAIPLASGDMTREELRQICVDFMRLQLSFEWTPDQNHDYTIDTLMHGGKPMSFKKGTLYAGCPYRAGTGCGNSGNLYTVMERYDPETGVLSSEGLTTDQWTALITNHCSSSCYWAWSRVINTMFGSSDDLTRQGWSNGRMVRSEGFLPVGPYTYTGISRWDEGDGTRAVCEANGEQVMFQSYAAMLPADGLIQLYPKGNTNANHVQMLAVKPEVAYLPDGSIDGENSFLTVLEQTSTPKKTTREDGETVYVEGGIDKRISFENMFKASYLPFTFAEFHGENPVEPLQLHLTHKNGEEIASLADLRDSTLTANYPVSSVKVLATDSDGKQTYLHYAHPDQIGSFTCALFAAVSAAPVSREKKGDGVEVTVQFGNGEQVTLYRDGETVLK